MTSSRLAAVIHRSHDMRRLTPTNDVHTTLIKPFHCGTASREALQLQLQFQRLATPGRVGSWTRRSRTCWDCRYVHHCPSVRVAANRKTRRP